MSVVDIDTASLRVDVDASHLKSSARVAREIFSSVPSEELKKDIEDEDLHTFRRLMEVYVEFSDQTLVVFQTSDGLQVVPARTSVPYLMRIYNSRTKYRESVLVESGAKVCDWKPEKDDHYVINESDESDDESDESDDESDDDESEDADDDSDDDDESDSSSSEDEDVYRKRRRLFKMMQSLAKRRRT